MFQPGEDENEPEEDWLPPREVTRELFLEWRAAGFADHPAQDFTNPVWLWLIDKNISAYTANAHFKGPDLILSESPAGWCFNRFGRTATDLPDGRRIIIGGEHEDHYDPDFFIYNDVVVVEKDGSLRILGYPEEHFPPTDFHSATLIGEEIVLIGSLGYPDQRKIRDTQVYTFDPRTLTFRQIETSGEKPGWISKHEAELNGGSIIVRGGMIDHGPEEGGYLQNFDSWSLDPEDWKWTRLSRRKIVRWKFHREDGEGNELFKMRMAKIDDVLRSLPIPPEIAEIRSSFLEPPPHFDRELLERLYDPPVPHEAVIKSPVDDRLHFVVEGIPVRFDEGSSREVLMTVEGELPGAVLQDYVELVRQRLSELEGCAYVAERSKA